MDNNQFKIKIEDDYSTNFIKIVKILFKYKRLYLKTVIIAFIIAAAITISLPDYYTCQIKMAPEINGNNTSKNSLIDLARSFGVKLGGISSSIGTDALFPLLYPDLIKSAEFKTSLFKVPVNIVDINNDSIRCVSYYNYIDKEQRKPWWISVFKSALQWFPSLFVDPYPVDSVINPFRLSLRQTEVLAEIDKNIVCSVDKKTSVITISVTDQNPLVCAIIADTVKQRLQEYITDYRIKKARENYEYYKKICAVAKDKYVKARQEYAEFADANRDVVSESIRQEIAELENETQIKFDNYSELVSQRQAAEDKIQVKKPVFTTLQSASVPLKKAGPKRLLICVMIMILFSVCLTIRLLYKEKLLKIAFGLYS
jgi:hypothetical protein